jgi:predicted nucleic acid-binding protein
VELAAAHMFRAKWTNRIHDEWIDNLLQNRRDLQRAQLERTRELMNNAVDDCLVHGYEDIIAAVRLPDPNDNHVLAAAIRGNCDAILTFNLADFPSAALAQYDIEAQHPDEFIQSQFDLNPAKLLVSVKKVRGRLKNPPKTIEEYLDALLSQGLLRPSTC